MTIEIDDEYEQDEINLDFAIRCLRLRIKILNTKLELQKIRKDLLTQLIKLATKNVE